MDMMDMDDVDDNGVPESDSQSEEDVSMPDLSSSHQEKNANDSGSNKTATPTPAYPIFDFTKEELEKIRTCIHDVSLPTWVQRPPSNLGEAAHGKLKAHELLVLFTVIFPLVMPILWWYEDDYKIRLLQSFCNLVHCTNIVAGYSVTNAEADAYTECYILYRRSIQEIFPWSNSVPNHHYAMHNSDMLKFWGPLGSLSEFFGERMNGEFGKTKTNRRFSESFPLFFFMFLKIVPQRIWS